MSEKNKLFVNQSDYENLLKLAGRMEAASNYLQKDKYPSLGTILLILGLDIPGGQNNVQIRLP